VKPDDEGTEDGTATIEFIGVSLLLLLPLLYLLLSVFAVQRAAFAVTQAAREAGRAYSTAPSSSVGQQRASYAAQLALRDQGVADRTSVQYAQEGSDCRGSSGGNAATLRPGARFTVCVRSVATLPLAGIGIPVRGRYAVAVDTYRRPR
jgi:Flp pilus assembly protein TadG